MKKQFLIVIATLTLGMVSCQKEKMISPVTPASDNAFSYGLPVGPRNAPVTSQVWVMSAFTINGEDKSASFDSYKFLLYSDYKVMATNGSYEILGKWDIVNGQYFFFFDTNSVVNLNGFPYGYISDLSFFLELNGNWDVLEKSPTSLLLGMTDLDRFKKLQFDIY